jgi:hypothetical protein
MAKADESGEWRDADDLHGPQAEAVLVEMSLDSDGAGVAFLARQDSGKKLHRERIGVDRGERREVLRTPGA